MESFENSKQERDLERDRQSFVEAIPSISVEEIQTKFDEVAVQKLAGSLKDTNLFILGEMHGVKENADIIYTLFKKFGFRQLALEWEPKLKDVIEKFLESGELDFDAIKDSADGRIIAGHFALLKKLKSEGILEGIICFDGGSGKEGWNARDAAMAKNILVALSDKAPTLAIAGNLHTRIEPIVFEDEAGEHHPMGENIKQEIPNLASGSIEYLSGQYHNFGTKEFGNFSEDTRSTESKFYQDENGLYVFELSQAHPAITPNPSERI